MNHESRITNHESRITNHESPITNYQLPITNYQLPITNREKMTSTQGERDKDLCQGPPAFPLATYRLQFNKDFTFDTATKLVPYLSQLGISHCYASPILKARAGSPHGYDIVDHSSLNPEIGSIESFDRFVTVLQRYHMGQIMDLVPNHMGVGGNDNIWWLDVLENGQVSIYAHYFDIEWRPIKDELRGKVLLALLGNHYGTVLENGELKLVFDAEHGDFNVMYYRHQCPIDPQTYPFILNHRLDWLEEHWGDQGSLAEFKILITSFGELPTRWETNTDYIDKRNGLKEIYKHRLAELCSNYPEVHNFIEQTVAILNGTKDDPASFDLLHRLLEAQAYRLAFWQVASQEINYRRFFDINELAGIRMENPEVFSLTHQLVFKLVAENKIQGIRLDHPDGLYNPAQYYHRLQNHLAQIKMEAMAEQKHTQLNPNPMDNYYVVVEKILASYERLPEDWPVNGTTGYEFVNLVNGLFIYPESEHRLERLYRRFVTHPISYDDLLYERKKVIMYTALSSELNVLASMINRISEADRYSRDFTLSGLREALIEVVACFPVYRTYITEENATVEDRRYIDWAIAHAKKRGPATEPEIFDFIHDVLLLEWPKQKESGHIKIVSEFAMKFQQYTAPVMAKGMEDTAFYVYNRLVSLNEVGGDPRRFGVSPAAFHHVNQDRLKRWPLAMISTSTHDTKRSEDVRMRINVITEMPEQWQHHIGRWSRFNRRYKHEIENVLMPGRNDEYLFYQTLIGAWPLEELDDDGLADFQQRIEAYMQKAMREAKLFTSWINPNAMYEEAMRQFIGSLLNRTVHNRFLADFLPFQKQVSRYGMFNSLSQVVLKLTVPGVPDLYQGCELWNLSLVDPDNRRPVDYEHRQYVLAELQSMTSTKEQALADFILHLLDNMQDGRIKMYFTWKLLQLRSEKSELFLKGDYLPLQAEGTKADFICSFARSISDQTSVTVTPRWFFKLCNGIDSIPIGETVWEDTWLDISSLGLGPRLRNILVGESIPVEERDGRTGIPLSILFKRFPYAVLVKED